MSPEIGDPVEHRVATVAKWGQVCYIWDMIKSNAPAAGEMVKEKGGEALDTAAEKAKAVAVDAKDAIAKKAKETADSAKKSVNARVGEIKKANNDNMSKK